MPTRLAILLVTVSAALWPCLAPAAPAAGDAPSLTLYSGLGFQGRQVTYGPGAARRVSPSFRARSAFSSGPWSLCDGAGPNSHCQTLDGAAARLKLEPKVVRLLGPAPAQASPGKPAAAPHAAAAPAVRVRARPIWTTARPVRRPASLSLRRGSSRPPGARWVYDRDVKRRARLAREDSYRSETAEPLADGETPVAYSCRDGRSLTVLFNPARATAEIRAGGEEPVVLARTEAPRGFRYESWGRAFYGEGMQAAYQVGGSGRLDCWAERPYP